MQNSLLLIFMAVRRLAARAMELKYLESRMHPLILLMMQPLPQALRLVLHGLKGLRMVERQ